MTQIPSTPLFRRLCLALVGLLLATAGFAQKGGDDELVKEFRKYFKDYKDTPTRVEAVLTLQGTESVLVVEALVPVLKLEEPEVVRAAVRVLASFKTQPPVDAMVAVIEKDKTEAVRVGLLQALAQGKYQGTAPALLALLTDKAWDVRRRAIQALAGVGDVANAGAIAPFCTDSEAAVRGAALEALATLKSDLVIPPATLALKDPVWQVRASAILALKMVRRRESIEPLIQMMATEEGRLSVEIGSALEAITGRNFGNRLDQWQNFWNLFKDKFQIPTDAELAKLREKQKATAEKYKPAGATTYHGIDTPSRKILFIIDCSGSMDNLVVEKERFQDGNYPSFLRIDIVKTELARTIDRLEPYVQFNILAFATDVRFWKKDLVPANLLNKTSARDFAMRLEAIGGSANDDLARVGLVGSANLEGGKTNTWGALSAALGIAGRGAKDKHYEVAIDTIFFLSDGRPSVGDYVDTDDILREVKSANELRKVVIHAVAIGEFQKDFMKRLAEENGGVFVDLGR
jgi:HEAT repeat protein